MNIKKVQIKAKTRKLKTRWTLECVEDELAIYFSKELYDEMVKEKEIKIEFFKEEEFNL